MPGTLLASAGGLQGKMGLHAPASCCFTTEQGEARGTHHIPAPLHGMGRRREQEGAELLGVAAPLGPPGWAGRQSSRTLWAKRAVNEEEGKTNDASSR